MLFDGSGKTATLSHPVTDFAMVLLCMEEEHSDWRSTATATIAHPALATRYYVPYANSSSATEAVVEFADAETVEATGIKLKRVIGYK